MLLLATIPVTHSLEILQTLTREKHDIFLLKATIESSKLVWIFSGVAPSPQIERLPDIAASTETVPNPSLQFYHSIFSIYWVKESWVLVHKALSLYCCSQSTPYSLICSEEQIKFTGLKKTSRRSSAIFVHLFLSSIFQEKEEATFACDSKKQVWVGIITHSRESEFCAGGIAASRRAHILSPAGENLQQKAYGLVNFYHYPRDKQRTADLCPDKVAGTRAKEAP